MYLKIEMFSVDSSHEIFNILIFDLMRMISSMQSASTEERLGGDFLLMNSCVGVLFEADKIQPHKTKSRDIGYSMTEIDRKHFNLQLHTKYSTTIFTDQKLLAPKVRAYR